MIIHFITKIMLLLKGSELDWALSLVKNLFYDFRLSLYFLFKDFFVIFIINKSIILKYFSFFLNNTECEFIITFLLTILDFFK